MEDLIEHLASNGELSSEHVERAVAALISGSTTDEVKAGFLRALRTKGETAGEIAGFARALLRRAVDPEIDPLKVPGPLVDVCGTGGDRLELFNISTTSMFILAAGGAVVVKHGNRAITSRCGGADVLEQLGVRIDLPPATLRRCVEELGLGFVYAPSYHPAFKAVVPVRKALAAQGVPTVFNILGPLLNPVQPAHQLIGIFARDLLDKYAAALLALGRKRAWVVHGNGADEITTTGPSDGREVMAGEIRPLRIVPNEAGIPAGELEELRGGDRTENARLLVSILDGSEKGGRRDIVLLNAAAGFVVAGLARDLPDGVQAAREQLECGGALAKLRQLQRFAG